MEAEWSFIHRDAFKVRISGKFWWNYTESERETEKKKGEGN